MLNVKVITVERLSKHGLFGRIRKELTVHRLQNFLYYYYLFISTLFIYIFYLGSVARRKSLLSKRSTAVGCRFAK